MNEWWLLFALVGFTVFASIFAVYSLNHRLIAGGILTPIIFLTAFLGYFYWGGFGEWQRYHSLLDSQKKAQKFLQSIKNPQELIDKLKAKLDNSPKSAKGWYLLGRLYLNQNKMHHAANSFAKAYQLNPNEEQYAINYAYSLWMISNQQMTGQITEILNQLLRKNPDQPDTLAMLAMNAFLHHSYEDAISYWQRLLKGALEQSEEAKVLRKAIAKAEERIAERVRS